MIGNILKVIAACLIGYLAGLLLGGALGILIGLVPSLFSREIFDLNLSIAMSILLFVILGGLLGYLEVRIFKRIFDTDDRPIWGLFIGTIFGLIFGVFGYGVLDASGAEAFSQYFSPVVLIYSGAAGSRIGSAIFSVFATVQTIREIVKSYQVQSLPGARNG